MTEPTFLQPFVMATQERASERQGAVDLYPPDSAESGPAIVFVHGGPLPAQVRPTPRDWPMFRGYGALAASRGVLGATVDHRLHSPADYAQAADDVAAAVDLVRADPRVDADRLAVWFFSGGGLLAADWLRNPPPWLRAVALSYPLLAPPPGWPVEERFRPVRALASAGSLPIVLTRAGLEDPLLAAMVEEFVGAAGSADLTIVDVPDGHHSFDIVDHTDQSREAVTRAFDLVLGRLGV